MVRSNDPVYEQLEFIFNLPTYSYEKNFLSKLKHIFDKIKNKAKRINPYFLIVFILLAHIISTF